MAWTLKHQFPPESTKWETACISVASGCSAPNRLCHLSSEVLRLAKRAITMVKDAEQALVSLPLSTPLITLHHLKAAVSQPQLHCKFRKALSMYCNVARAAQSPMAAAKVGTGWEVTLLLAMSTKNSNFWLAALRVLFQE